MTGKPVILPDPSAGVHSHGAEETSERGSRDQQEALPGTTGLMARLRWWLAALGVALGPLFLFVLPALLGPAQEETAAAGFTAMAEEPSPWHLIWFLSQLLGATFLATGAMGMVSVLIGRRRWIVPGHIGGGLVLLGSLGVMVTVGMEIAQLEILRSGEDTQAMVALAVAINDSAVFVSFLLLALAGIFLGSLLLIISLWRARFIPAWTLGLFVLPVALAIVLPGRLGEIGGLAGIALPFIWISWLMLKEPGAPYAPPGGEG